MFLANTDVRLSRSRFYMFLHWYVHLTPEKYNSNYSFIIIVYFCLLCVLSDFSIIRSRLTPN